MTKAPVSSRFKSIALLALLTFGLLPVLGAQSVAVAEEVAGITTRDAATAAALRGSRAVADEPADGIAADLLAFSESGSADGDSVGGLSGEVPSLGSDAEPAPLLASSASQLSQDVPLQPLSEADGVPLLAEALAGEPTRFVNQEVSLDGGEPVLGSFTVGGMTYAVTGEGTVELAAAGNRMVAAGLARDFFGAEGASDDAPSALVALAIPGSVEHGGTNYAVTSVGPRALAGCDADAVVLPDTVEAVDEAAFRGSPAASVEVAGGNPSLASAPFALLSNPLPRASGPAWGDANFFAGGTKGAPGYIVIQRHLGENRWEGVSTALEGMNVSWNGANRLYPCDYDQGVTFPFHFHDDGVLYRAFAQRYGYTQTGWNGSYTFDLETTESVELSGGEQMTATWGAPYKAKVSRGHADAKLEVTCGDDPVAELEGSDDPLVFEIDRFDHATMGFEYANLQYKVYGENETAHNLRVERRGYRFVGWQAENDPDNSVLMASASRKMAPGETYTALWEGPLSYAISYDLAGGSLPLGAVNPSSYTVEDSFGLQNPVRPGYTFRGWIEEGNSTALPILSVTVPKGSVGDRAYVACWAENVANFFASPRGTTASGVYVEVDGYDVGPSTSIRWDGAATVFGPEANPSCVVHFYQGGTYRRRRAWDGRMRAACSV